MENPSSAENQTNYEYEYSPEDVVIDPFTCDLNLVVDKECLLAYPLSSAGFCSMWAGCRATYGVSSGRVAFEIHMTDYCECPDLAKDDLEPNLIRVGWSINYSSLQLGESELSFGYASNGKKCCNKTFEDYGDQFDKADSIAAYIDFESEKDTIVISYSKNGIDQGIAFRLKRTELENHVTKVMNDCSDSVLDKDKFKSDLLVFFPHVLTKNVVFEVNFGQRVSLIGDEPFAPIKSSFELIQKRPLDARFSNAPPRVKRDKNEYEVILMIGLPGSGKTNWANEYIRKHVRENYYIIGIGSILEKMKMLGIRKKANISQAGELAVINSLSANSLAKISSDLLDKTLKCMNVLMDIASHSLRNTIIDQPNVFTSTRRRNLNIFKGFRTKAVVVVPNDDVYKQRVDQLAEDIKSSLPFIINNMKIGFTLPKPGEFDSIEYAELDEEESRKLIALYNSQGAEDRLDRLLLRRAKKNEDIRKNSKLNPALFMRPTYRPQFPYGSSTSSFTWRPRFGAQILPPGAAGAAAIGTMGFPRRPFNQPYPNQYISNAAYGNQQLVYAYSPSLVTSPTGATVVGLAPNQATADPNLIFNQWPQQQQQMQFNMYGMPASPYHALYHQHQQQQQAAQHQYAPIYGPNPTQPKQAAYQTQNSWDPVVSTNLSHSIASSSAYSTDLASNLTTKTPENSNNDTNQN